VVERKLASGATAARLSEAELFEFLLLPGFTLAQSVTDVSGRGVGLDAVQDMLKQVRGSLRIASNHGKGTQFQLLLPLTLSVVRALLVEVAGEPFAIPLAGIARTLKVRRPASHRSRDCRTSIWTASGSVSSACIQILESALPKARAMSCPSSSWGAGADLRSGGRSPDRRAGARRNSRSTAVWGRSRTSAPPV